MQRTFLFPTAIALLCLGCTKELDVDTLNTNTLDPDYAGASLIEVQSTSMYYFLAAGGVPDSSFRVHCRVIEDRFPLQTTYSVRVVKSTGGIVGFGPVQGSGDFEFNVDFNDPVHGTDYCFTTQILVLNSGSAVWRACERYE